MKRIVGIAMGVGLLVACSKDKVAPAPPGSEPQAPAAEHSGPKTFASMSEDGKKQHMMEVVVPTMGGLFRGANPSRYETFDCVTCHGAGAKEGRFAMPSADLPKIPANGQFAALMEGDKAAVTQFMMNEVVPKMAETLGVSAYDPETHEGFGCYGCHQSQ